jgi:hypothetical protein
VCIIVSSHKDLSPFLLQSPAGCMISDIRYHEELSQHYLFHHVSTLLIYSEAKHFGRYSSPRQQDTIIENNNDAYLPQVMPVDFRACN